jgi:hypothetical protein
MDELIQIPVTVMGEERAFEGRVQTWKYGIRLSVEVDGAKMIFEKDEAGAYRAILPEGFEGKMPGRKMVDGIAGVLNGL